MIISLILFELDELTKIQKEYNGFQQGSNDKLNLILNEKSKCDNEINDLQRQNKERNAQFFV